MPTRGDEERVPELPQKVDAHVHNADQPNSTSQNARDRAWEREGRSAPRPWITLCAPAGSWEAADATVHTISGRKTSRHVTGVSQSAARRLVWRELPAGRPDATTEAVTGNKRKKSTSKSRSDGRDGKSKG